MASAKRQRHFAIRRKMNLQSFEPRISLHYSPTTFEQTD
jgi:hypothetical protein